MRHAWHAEFTKLRTAPGTVGLLLAILLATVAVSALAGAGGGCDPRVCELDAVEHSLTGVHIGQVLVAVFAVAVVGGEYGTGMIHASLVAVPRRLTLAAAKIGTALTVIAGVAAVAVPAALVAGRVGLVRHGHGFALNDPDTVRAGLGSIGYLVLIGLMSLGLALAVRGAIAAIGGTLGLLYLFPLLAATVNDEQTAETLYRLSPMTAGLSVQATVGLDDAVIAPLPGLAVTGCWAAAALALGVTMLRLRDA